MAVHCVKLAALLLAAFSVVRGQMPNCRPLQSISNGTITYSPPGTPPYAPGTVATYSCDDGYVLDLSDGGSETRTCVDDGGMGVFTGQAPSCVLTCAPLSAIGNGTIEYFPRTSADIPLGTAAIYQCDEGFYLSLEERVRTCEDREGAGVFSGQTPSCVFAELVYCFRRAGQNCGGAFLAETSGGTCCQETETGGFGGGGYTVLDLNRCIVCDRDVVVGFDPPSYMVEEGGVVDFRVVLTGNIDVPVTLSFRTENETAVAPGDYTAVRMTLTFNPGDPSEIVVSIETRNDEVPENDEFFTGQLELVSAQSRVSLGISEASVVVFDDDAMCEDLPPLVNGNITYQPDELTRRAGTVANHTCREGYLLIGEKIRECVVMNRTALYDGSAPVCEALCDELPAIANGTISYSMTPITAGVVATYTCDRGYDLGGGNVIRTCMDSGDGGGGVFGGVDPVCQPIECLELPPLTNGMITYSPDSEAPYALFTEADHMCNQGYRLVGVQTRICEDVGTAVGEFNREPPTCEAVCDALDAIANGMISYSTDMTAPYSVGTVATYTCNSGYELSTTGDEMRTCMDNGDGSGGSFGGSAPTCQPVCDELEEIENGTISYSPDMTAPYSVGIVATYTCNSGYELSTTGDEMRTCVDGGSAGAFFNGEAPTCEPVCGPLDAIANGVISYSADMSAPYSEGTVATYTCNSGYELSTTGDEMRTCVDGGSAGASFSGEAPTCEPVCGALDAIANGMISYSTDMTAPYSVGTVATYTCNSGYELSTTGDEMRTCMDNGDGSGGSFGGSAPTCQPVCGALDAIANGMITYSADMTAPYSVGTVATYTCNSGYELSSTGDEMRNCMDNGDGSGGSFGGSAPTCHALCPPLAPIANGMITYGPDTVPDYSVGTIATYMCDDGFNLGENMVRVCQSDGTFSGTDPVCTDAGCVDLPSLDDGMIVYNMGGPPRPIDTVATHSCNSGFFLNGAMTRTCVLVGSAGMFDGEAPTCDPIECLELDPLENGMITYSPDSEAPYALGTEADHMCNQGYRLVGVQTRVCEDVGTTVGEFSEGPPTCEQIVCADLPALANAAITYNMGTAGDRPVGTVATYECNEGFVLKGDGMRTCQDNEMFDGMEPTCEPLCPALDPLVNGDIEYSIADSPFYPMGTVASHSCNQGYALTGPENRTCVVINVNSAEFDRRPPVCDPVCDEIPPPPNGMITYTQNPDFQFPNGTVAVLNCGEGFSPVNPGEPGGPVPSIELVCVEVEPGEGGEFVPRGGSTQGQELRCDPSCEMLPEIANGVITYSPDTDAPFSVGTVATYTCNDGYELVSGSRTRTCINTTSDGGEFDGMEPRCRPGCVELPVIANGMISYAEDMTPLFDIDTVATYKCNQGFRFVEGVGDPVRRCVDRGAGELVFSGSAPQCAQVPVCIPPMYLLDNMCTNQCPSGFLGNHETGSCETLPQVFGLLANATAYYLSLQTDTPPGASLLDYTLLIDQNTIGTPENIALSLMADPEVEGAFGFDNGQSVKEYTELPEGYAVDERNVGSFQETVFLRGEVPSMLLGNGMRQFSVYLNSEVSGSSGEESGNNVTMFVSLSEPPVVVELAESSVTVSEGEGVAIVPIMKAVTPDDIIVTVVIEGNTAEAGKDYGPFSIPILRLATILPANQTMVDFGIPIFEDSVVEHRESLTVRLESVDSQVTIGGVASTVVYIEDNDVVEFILGLKEGSSVVIEEDVMLTYNITKVGMADRDVRVVVRTANGSARAGGDFQELSLPLTFAPRDTVMEFQVIVNQDNVVEDTEMFSVTFDPAPGETGVGPISDSPIITIQDDTDFVTVRLSSDLFPVIREGSAGRVTVQSSGNNEIPVTVIIEVSDDSTAVAGVDYFLNVSSLTFDPEMTSLSIPVTAINDNLFEADSESLVLIGRPDMGGARVAVVIDPGAAMATVNIEDTDSVRVGFATPELTVGESSQLVNITVQLTEGRLAVGVVVTIEAVGELAVAGEDFNFSSIDLTFEPDGHRSLVAEVVILDDEVFEGREGFSLSLTSSNDRVILSPSTQQVLIVDNEDLVISFSSVTYSVNETDPSLEFIVQLGEEISLQREITLDLRTSSESATGGLDFVPLNTILTFGPNVTMATNVVTLLDDEISEGLEIFFINIVLVNEALGDPGVLQTATVLLFDNEDIFVRLSSVEYVVNEGERVALIRIDKTGVTPNNEDTTLLLTLSDGTAQGGVDYGPFPVAVPSSTLTAFSPANVTQTLFGIPITDDNLVEGEESFTVTMEIFNERSREEGGIVFLGNVTMATILIEDNDMINVSLVTSRSVGGVVNVEEGFVQLNFSAVRSDSVRLVRNVTVFARTRAGSAEGPSDYEPTEVALSFLPGTDETQSVPFYVRMFDDAVAEGNESFVVELVTDDSNVMLAVSSVQINIQDNDVAMVEFVSPSYEAFELERSVEVCLSKSADTALPFTVTVVPMETSDVQEGVFDARADVDFDATPRNVTFEPTANQSCVSISVFQDGMPGEGLEVFSLRLVGLVYQASIEIGSLNTVDVFINDVPDVILGFQSSSLVSVREDVGDVEVCVGVFNPAPDEVLNTTLTLIIETAPGTADSADFSPLSLSINLTNTLRSDCFQVGIFEDGFFEDPAIETFTVLISSFVSSNTDFRVLASPSNITIAISDVDREVVIGFAQSTYQVVENQTALEVCVVVTIPPRMEMFTSDFISLFVTTVEGTANESDYSPFMDRLVGNVGNDNREECFTVEIVDDLLVEVAQEAFTLTLAAEVPPGADISLSIDPSTTLIIIINDDFPIVTSTPTLVTPTPTLVTPTSTLVAPTSTLVTLTPSLTISTVSLTTSTPSPTPTPVVDTIVGDPLFSVPLNFFGGLQLFQLSTYLHLCYEIHGKPDTYLNLVSDACTNINAHYAGMVPDTDFSLGLNIITQIGVRARDLRGRCVRVLVDSASNCTPVVMTQGNSVQEMRYDRDGVVVSKVRNRARISVPNCGHNRLVMWVTCQARGMLRFDLTRGIGLAPTSHGLLGQFWNVPISISKYTYEGDPDEIYLDPARLYAVNITNPTTGSTRRFIAEYDEQVWDLSNKDCLYAGNIQGGRLGDIRDPNVGDSVIEGDYMQYAVEGMFASDFTYSQFVADQCV